MEDHVLISIFSVAQNLFFERGIKSVSIEDICSKIGISKKTFYKYFESKEALLLEIAEKYIETERAKIDEIKQKSENAIQELYEIYQMNTIELINLNSIFIEEIKKSYINVWQLMSNHIEIECPLFIADNLEKGQKKGLYKNDIDIPFIVHLYTKNQLMVIDYFAQNKNESLNQLLFKFYNFFIQAICTETGIQEFNKIFIYQSNYDKKNNAVN
jgi:AcrR family transcriptional regulator